MKIARRASLASPVNFWGCGVAEKFYQNLFFSDLNGTIYLFRFVFNVFKHFYTIHLSIGEPYFRGRDDLGNVRDQLKASLKTKYI